MRKWMMMALVVTLGFSGTLHAAPTNKELKIGISQEFENMNPLVMTMAATVYMARMTLRTLVVLDADAKWVTQLAKDIPSLEKGTARIVEQGGKRKIVADWEILENAKWGDGKPVTCEDFAFAREVAASPNVSVGEKEVFTQIEKIEWDAKTPKKCTFTYEKAKWDFYQLANFFPLPKHIEGPVFQKFGKQKEGYEKNSNYVKSPTNKALYNGPYVVTGVRLGDHVQFERNPHFYGEQAKIEKIIVKLISNTGTMEANLRSGTIDMISTLGIALDQALALEKKVKAERLPYQVQYVPSITYEHIDVNLDNPILKDVRVRQALLHAINREDLVRALFEGKQTAAQHFVSPKDPWYTTDPKFVKTYRYSKREAQKLLEAAGWTVGRDGYRYKDGKKLALTFMTTAGNKTRELVQTYLQEQWKQVGIEVLIKNEPAKVFFGETMRRRNYGALAMYAWISSPENNPRSTLHSASIPTEKNGFSGQNNPGWKNAEVDKIIDAIDLEFDAKKRMAHAWELQKHYTHDVPVLPLYYRADISVPPAGLKNYRMPGHQFYETNQIEKWTF